MAAIAITPGFLRSESMLEGFGVTEENWREAGKKDKNFLTSESPLYIGRAVAALAADPKIIKRSGQLFSSWELAREYKFTDVDGTRPGWGKLKIDFSGMPPDFLAYFRIGSSMTLEWLDRVTTRLKSFRKQLPREATERKNDLKPVMPRQPRQHKFGWSWAGLPHDPIGVHDRSRGTDRCYPAT